MKKFFFPVPFLFISLFLFGQEEKYPFELEKFGWDSVYNKSNPKVLSFFEFGISANSYSGDLSSYKKWTNSFFFGIKLNKKKGVNSHFLFGIGTLAGENLKYEFIPEKGKATPNKYFKTDFFQFQYDLQFNIIKRRNLIVYLSQGIGILRFTVRNLEGENLLDITTSRPEEEVYGSITPILPFSIGGMYILKNGYASGFQVGFLNPLSDYLDNIGEWGIKSGNDNALMCRFSLFVPIKKQNPTQIPEKSNKILAR